MIRRIWPWRRYIPISNQIPAQAGFHLVNDAANFVDRSCFDLKMEILSFVMLCVSFLIFETEGTDALQRIGLQDAPDFDSPLSTGSSRYLGRRWHHPHASPYYWPYHRHPHRPHYANATSTVTKTGTTIVILTQTTTATATPASTTSINNTPAALSFSVAETSSSACPVAASSPTSSYIGTVPSTLTFGVPSSPSFSLPLSTTPQTSISTSKTLLVPQSSAIQTLTTSPTATLVVIGTSVLPIVSATSGAVVLPNGQTLSPGQATTVLGATISLQPSGSIVVVGAFSGLAPPLGAGTPVPPGGSANASPPFAIAGTPTGSETSIGLTALTGPTVTSAVPEVDSAATAARPHSLLRRLMTLSWMCVSLSVLL